MAELTQTKSNFKLIGHVSRIDKESAFKEEQSTKEGKHLGETYRTLRFSVKTSDTNEIFVQMFDYEPEQVFLWNSDKKKKDKSYKGDWVDYQEWEERQDELREEGYAVLQTRVGVEEDENGKIKSHGLPSYVAQEVIYNNLNNGDSVVIEGEIRYSRYTPQNSDKEKEQKSYFIKKIFKLTKDVDFEDEKFEECTYFDQEMVYVDTDIDRKQGKAFVTGRIINYDKTFHDTQMVINFKTGEDEHGKPVYDAGMVKLADAFKKRFKFGDVVKVFGDVLNRVIVEEKEDDGKEQVDLFKEFGGKHKPKSAETFTAKTYIQEHSIYGVENWEKSVYKDEDFVDQGLMEKDDDDAMQNEFGGKKKKKNPFEEDPFAESGKIDISEDDLPF